ncbi:hypothetical protein IB257_10830 [Achromobacter sp. ACM03]|uniref:hypothetical protein n=1 Tax=Achromobacter sp. ACM03 TaxID=2769300 RepID=UPI00177D0331|nr:hypothetical protein [Achromobacter sp. ACM03]MBD9430430.1 hypothetical protein [Achromobacter sp. ACM03]
MNLVQTIVDLDQATDLHLARILILLNAFYDTPGGGPIEGITKLAKLDFLLRYPVMLQKALEARGRSTQDVKLEEHEKSSVESAMVRYRFGPWDHRYREFLNILTAKNLAFVTLEGRKVVIAPTAEGQKIAKTLGADPLFEAHARRAIALKRHLDLGATNLMKFVYNTFPEILSLRSNSTIPT